ncbi:uncharacterized protein LOC141685859 [Apium graveolens]|uniref:uncharacterized protein LOC141685859 n=1 Tax=Apium graveolens TaxID=4045 RepID=UPI003D7A538B
MEKLVYALIFALRKLRLYFHAHRIEIRIAYPLRQVLHKPGSSGRMLKWAVELGQFDFEYMPHSAIKGQALADFLLEFDSAIDDNALVMLQPPRNEESLEEFPHPWWILHVDGAVNNGGAGTGIVFVSPKGHHLMSAIHFKFYATNNDAEYEALINGLKIALEMGVQNIIARSDSEVVVNQVNGGFQARGPRTELYLRCTQRLIEKFREVRLECVPREKNNNTDYNAPKSRGILQGDYVDLGMVIYQGILRFLRGSTAGSIPYASVVTKLCVAVGVQWSAHEQLQIPSAPIDSTTLATMQEWDGGTIQVVLE